MEKMLFGGLNHKLAKSSCCVSLAKCDRHIQTAPAVQQQHINAFFFPKVVSKPISGALRLNNFHIHTDRLHPTANNQNISLLSPSV